ncbi:MAG: methyl-accepting chemotaxis protein [Pseudomonadota bacterium]
MLNPKKAQEICDKIAKEIGENVIICSTGGEIVAASNRSRIGHTHAIGAKIMAGEVDHYHVSAEMAASSEGMLEGYSTGVDVSGQRLASIGVTGPVEVARRFAMVAADWAAHMIEADALKAAREAEVVELTEALEKDLGGILGMIATHMGEARMALSEGSDAAEKTRQSAHEASNAAEATQTASSQMQAQMKDLGQQTRTMDRRVKDTSASVTEVDVTSASAIETVEKLSSSNRDIGKALDLIKGVAMKTRLLSLNARVEAARAGEAGRGFAVVAQEVGSLSDQTSETTDQIERDVAKLEERASHVIKSLGEITERVTSMGMANSSMEEEFKEQTTSIDMVAEQIKNAASNTMVALREIRATDAAAEKTLTNVRSAETAAKETEVIVSEARSRLAEFIAKLQHKSVTPVVAAAETASAEEGSLRHAG